MTSGNLSAYEIGTKVKQTYSYESAVQESAGFLKNEPILHE